MSDLGIMSSDIAEGIYYEISVNSNLLYFAKIAK